MTLNEILALSVLRTVKDSKITVANTDEIVTKLEPETRFVEINLNGNETQVKIDESSSDTITSDSMLYPSYHIVQDYSVSQVRNPNYGDVYLHLKVTSAVNDIYLKQRG